MARSEIGPQEQRRLRTQGPLVPGPAIRATADLRRPPCPDTSTRRTAGDQRIRPQARVPACPAGIAAAGAFAYGGVVRGVPWWGVVSSAVAPVLLAGGWTVAAGLQPRSFNPVADTISSLAAQGATDRQVMTLALAGVGACHVLTGLALRPAAWAGRLILMTGGLATVLVAANPEPAGGGGSLPHTCWAAIGFIALTAWPLAAWKRGPLVPAGLRPAVSASAAGVLLGLLAWFGAELIAGAGRSAWPSGSWPGRRRPGRWRWS